MSTHKHHFKHRDIETIVFKSTRDKNPLNIVYFFSHQLIAVCNELIMVVLLRPLFTLDTLFHKMTCTLFIIVGAKDVPR